MIQQTECDVVVVQKVTLATVETASPAQRVTIGRAFREFSFFICFKTRSFLTLIMRS